MRENCGICGGDGRIANSFGNTTMCPGCHGTGRRPEVTGLRDVTKTKASHHRVPNAPGAEKPQGPTTFEGVQLAAEVQATPHLASEAKARLVREIMEHENSHPVCTKTFLKKIRKQVRPASSSLK